MCLELCSYTANTYSHINVTIWVQYMLTYIPQYIKRGNSWCIVQYIVIYYYQYTENSLIYWPFIYNTIYFLSVRGDLEFISNQSFSYDIRFILVSATNSIPTGQVWTFSYLHYCVVTLFCVASLPYFKHHRSIEPNPYLLPLLFYSTGGEWRPRLPLHLNPLSLPPAGSSVMPFLMEGDLQGETARKTCFNPLWISISVCLQGTRPRSMWMAGEYAHCTDINLNISSK